MAKVKILKTNNFNNILGGSEEHLYPVTVPEAIINENNENLSLVINKLLNLINTNKASIDSDITDILTTIGTHTSQFNTLLNSINNNKISIDSINSDITNIQTTLDTHTDKINNLFEIISDYLPIIEESFPELLESVELTERDIENIDGRLGTAESSIESIQSSINELSSDINDHEGHFEAINVFMASIEKNHNDLAETVNGFDSRISELEKADIGDLANLLATVETHTERLNTIDSYNIPTLKEDVETLKQTDIGTISSRVDTLESTVSLHGQSITTVASNYNTLNTSVDNLTTKVSGIETGSVVSKYAVQGTIGLNLDKSGTCINFFKTPNVCSTEELNTNAIYFITAPGTYTIGELTFSNIEDLSILFYVEGTDTEGDSKGNWHVQSLGVKFSTT